MNMQTPRIDEFRTMVSSLLDGTVTPQQFEQIEQAIIASDEHLEIYRCMACIDATLSWWQRWLPAQQDVHAHTRREPGLRSLRFVRILAMAAAVALVVGIGWLSLKFGHQQEDTGAAHEVMTPTAAPIALLADMENAVFADSMRAMDLGAAMTPGPVKLRSGKAQIMFDSTAVIDLSGPCEFVMTGPNRGRLTSGRLEVYVPERARGFVLDLPHGVQVVDLGTRFNVVCDEQGDATVRVDQGIVEIRMPAQNGGEPAVQRLTAGALVSIRDGRIQSHQMLADARGDYRPGDHVGATTQSVNPNGLSAAHHGFWNYYSSTSIAADNLRLLTYGRGGSSNNFFYRGDEGSENGGFDLPAVSDRIIFTGPEEGSPADDELAIHGDFGPRSFGVVRWTAGPDESGRISIAGHARKLGTGFFDGIEFAIYVDGERVFYSIVPDASGSRVPFDLEHEIHPGRHVDFVYGSRANFNNDQTGLRAVITRLSPDSESIDSSLDIHPASTQPNTISTKEH